MAAPPRLLFFTDADPGPADPPPDTIPDKRGFMRALAAQGVEGEYVVFRGKPWNPLADRHAIWRAIDPVRALWALTRRRDATAILSFAESGILVPLLLRPFHRIRLAVLHDSDHQDWRPRKLIQAFVLPRADLVLTQTKAQARYLAQQYRLRRPPIYVGPRIDEAFFRPMSEGAGDYVLAVGNDGARDFATLVAAAAPLDMRVVLLTRLPVQLPADSRCRFEIIDRRVSFRELRDLYAGARIVALPMHERISPGGMTSLLEAMAMGRASVLTASSGVVELAEDGRTALVTPLGDVAAFRAALSALWDDPARAIAMGEAARARFDQEYSTERYAARIAEAITIATD